MVEPLVTIAMAIYNPNINWLEKQLASINELEYSNINLMICDDSSTTISYEGLNKIVEEIITKFPYKVLRNELNIGSNKTFERLTEEANGDFIAYCDQDDIWEKDKIEKLAKAMQESNVTLAYSDMSLIDEKGYVFSKSIARTRRRFYYYSGEDLWKRLLIRNFISGCCMIIKTEVAKKAIPFIDGMHHDRWLAIVASVEGNIRFVNEPLVRYRQHLRNQTGVLKDVCDKGSYCKIRLIEHKNILIEIQYRIVHKENIYAFLVNYLKEMDTRIKWFYGDKRFFLSMLKIIPRNYVTIIFEILLPFFSDKHIKRILLAISTFKSNK